MPGKKHIQHFVHTTTALTLISLLAFAVGCNGGKVDEVPIDDVVIDLKVARLDTDMQAAAPAYKTGQAVDSSQVYRQHFAAHRAFLSDWMFGGDDRIATDSVLTIVMHEFLRDSHGLALLDSVDKRLPAGYDPRTQLEPLFKRFHFYFPEKALPVVVTYVDGYPGTMQQGIDQVFISPRFLGIGLHYLVGPDFKFYPADMPMYIRRRCTIDYLPTLVAHKIAESMVPDPDLSKNPVLVDFVVQQGIRMALVDKLLGPEVPDSIKLFYTAEQMEWADYYQGKAYKDLMGDLYKLDPQLLRRYMDDSPFTSQLNRESAPRLGQFLGWKIVTEYLKKKPNITLPELVKEVDYKRVFKESGYRPANGEE
jgi:hypothetical protein